MKRISRFVALSLLAAGLATGAALADECKKIRGAIADVQVTEGCTSPNRFCAEGVVTGNHGFNGTTYFRMDGAVRGPATQPGSFATSGILVYTFGDGTLTVRESGLSGLNDPSGSYFTSFQQVLEGTGEYAGATGHLWVLGQAFGTRFEAGLIGEICKP